jgi:hypothetical protein
MYGQERASVMPAIAYRATRYAIVAEFLVLCPTNN